MACSGGGKAGALAALVAVAAAYGVGCSDEALPPYRPRPGDDGGPPQPADGGEGQAGHAPPAVAMRPSGQELADMIMQLAELGADTDDPDRVCTGWSHACGIDAQGRVHCFGDDGDGQASPPPSEVAIKQVACGISFTCALDEQGTIACWGAGSDPDVLDLRNYAQSVPPEGEFKQITAGVGGSHACAIAKDGFVQCWGAGSADKPETANANFGQARPPGDLTFVRIAAGEAHTCGIRTNGEIRCWGAGGDRCFPTSAYACGQTSAPDGTFVDIAAGELHTCALRSDGTATCWGQGLNAAPCAPDSGGGEFDCGQGLVPGDLQTHIVRLRAGNLHTCAITDEYEVMCWGWNSAGQLDPPKLYAFTQVVGGDQFSCGFASDGTVQCWGGVPGPVPAALQKPL